MKPNMSLEEWIKNNPSTDYFDIESGYTNMWNTGFQPGQMNIFAAPSTHGKSFMWGSNHRYKFKQYYTTYNKKKRSKYPFIVTSQYNRDEVEEWLNAHYSYENWYLWKHDGVYYYRFKHAKDASLFKLTWGGE